jgi:hypothetical protein
VVKFSFNCRCWALPRYYSWIFIAITAISIQCSRHSTQTTDFWFICLCWQCVLISFDFRRFAVSDSEISQWQRCNNANELFSHLIQVKTMLSYRFLIEFLQKFQMPQRSYSNEGRSGEAPFEFRTTVRGDERFSVEWEWTWFELHSISADFWIDLKHILCSFWIILNSTWDENRRNLQKSIQFSGNSSTIPRQFSKQSSSQAIKVLLAFRRFHWQSSNPLTSPKVIDLSHHPFISSPNPSTLQIRSTANLI